MNDPHFTEASYDDVTFVRIREDTLLYTVDYYVEVVVKHRLDRGKWKLLFTTECLTTRPTRREVLDWLRDCIHTDPIKFHDHGIDTEEVYLACGGDRMDLYT